MITATDMTTDITPPIRVRRVKTASTAAAPTAPNKSETVVKLLLRVKGATPIELIAATDWQAHSVRAFLSGLRKKGRSIVREARKSGEFAYRIVATEPVSSALDPSGE